MDFPSHPALQDYTGFLMRKISAVTAARFGEVTGRHGLHPMHFGMLTVLDADSPIAQNELAARIGVDPSTMVARMDVLEEQGMVERRRSAEDRRAYEITLTRKGRSTLTALRREAKGLSDEVFGVLSERERTALRASLQKVEAELDRRRRETASA